MRYWGESRYMGSREAPKNPQSAETLTPQEHKVLLLAVKGRTNGEIASELGIAQNTVKNHLAHIYAKMGVGNRTELASEYLRRIHGNIAD